MKSILTERQFQIMELRVWGKSSKEIANALEISVFTVDKTLSNSYDKLGITASQATEVYLTRHIEIPAEKNPLLRYDFRPRITTVGVIKETCKYAMALLLFTGVWTEITTAHEMMRTIRNGRNMRYVRCVRRSDNPMMDFYSNLIITD